MGAGIGRDFIWEYRIVTATSTVLVVFKKYRKIPNLGQFLTFINNFWTQKKFVKSI
jgi:hypothetical protein